MKRTEREGGSLFLCVVDLPPFVINSNLLLGERIDWPSFLPERASEALSWPGKCRSGNEQDRAEAAREEEITKRGREEEKGALSFSLCIHSDFPLSRIKE